MQWNRNNFESYEECVQTCAPKIAIVPDNDVTDPKEENTKDGDTDKFVVTEPVVAVPSTGVQATFKSPACAERPITGQCFGYFPRYYYNPAKDSCEEFIYGGCHGNGNNFETVQECENSCKLGKLPQKNSLMRRVKILNFPIMRSMKFLIMRASKSLECRVDLMDSSVWRSFLLGLLTRKMALANDSSMVDVATTRTDFQLRKNVKRNVCKFFDGPCFQIN